MHIHHKLGLFLLFILSFSICLIHAAPTKAQNASEPDDDYDDDYDYYDEAASTSSETPLQGDAAPVEPTKQLNTPFDFSRTNRIRDIEPICPKACSCEDNFKEINCAKAGLKQVPKNLPYTAHSIDLSGNHIQNLHDNDFINCTKVQQINLSYNDIQQLNSQSFAVLKNLKRLNLSNNKLSNIEPQTFSAAENLLELDLSNNSIVLPSEHAFLNQPDLLEFSCYNCSWTQLYDNTFENMAALQSLRLNGNDFNKQINTQAFIPLRNLVKLRLPELEQSSVEQLCNLLKSIDNISFTHFDVTCFELVLGASYNESLITATDPPYKKPVIVVTPAAPPSKKNSAEVQQNSNRESNMANNSEYANHTSVETEDEPSILTASLPTSNVKQQNSENQVNVSPETINIMLICIIIIAVVGIIIGIICRKDVGGIKTKCCRTSKPEPKDQVHPAEEIPLNKLA